MPPNRNPIATILADEAITKTPKSSTYAIARKLFADHPEVFRSIEQARTCVKRARDRAGKAPPAKTRAGRVPLPKPVDAESVAPLDIDARSVLVMSDIHVPYHDEKALTTAVEYGIKADVDHVVLLGDILDFFSISRWEKDPRKRDFKREVEAGRQFFRAIRSAFPSAAITWKIGNHEERWESFLFQRAPELVGVDFLDLASIYETGEIAILDRMQHPRVDHINLIHGHEFGKSVFSPVNPARGLFLRSKATALCGHSHQTSVHVETNMNRTVTGCWSLGCLCDLRPRYAPYNKWNHGFAVITRDGELSRVDNLKIINGKIV